MEGVEIDPSEPVVSGQIDGLEVTFRLVTRGSGSSAESWTECEVAMATDQLDITLRPQTRAEERWVNKGLARDLLVGDEGFDDKFIVEAAPVELAKQALGPDIRAELLAQHPVTVKSRPEGLLLEKRGWVEAPEAIRAFATMGAHLATNMETVVAQARQDDQREAALVGYRGAEPEAQRAGEDEARQETDELKALRERRQQAEKTRNAIMIGLFLAGLLAMGLVSGYC